MACNGYIPPFQRQLNPGDPLGSLNCTCYSAAMAGNYHTCGAKRPLGERVRELTYDRVGGTTLLQVDAALYRGWGINLDTRMGSSKLTWTQFAAKINAGHGAILQGGYSAINRTRFTGSKTFTGNHAIFVPPRWLAMDPLADGRYAGIYKFHREAYPQTLLKDFAGRLILDPVIGRRLGYGYVWASLTRDNTSNLTYQYKVVVPKGTKLLRYQFNGDKEIIDYSVHTTGGFSAYCSAPKVWPADSRSGLPFKFRTLVRITDPRSHFYHWYIGARYAKEI